MKYEEVHSAKKEGLKFFLLGLFILIVWLGVLIHNDSLNRYDSILREWQDIKNFALLLLHVLVTLAVTGFAISFFRLALRQVFSHQEWLVRVSPNKLYYHTPDKKMGESFELPLEQIRLFKKLVNKGSEGGTSVRWIMITESLEKVHFHQYAPFDFDTLVNVVTEHNPNIELILEET